MSPRSGSETAYLSKIVRIADPVTPHAGRIICSLRHASGYSVASYDNLYGKQMEFLSASGFALLAWH